MVGRQLIRWNGKAGVSKQNHQILVLYESPMADIAGYLKPLSLEIYLLRKDGPITRTVSLEWRRTVLRLRTASSYGGDVSLVCNNCMAITWKLLK